MWFTPQWWCFFSPAVKVNVWRIHTYMFIPCNDHAYILCIHHLGFTSTVVRDECFICCWRLLSQLPPTQGAIRHGLAHVLPKTILFLQPSFQPLPWMMTSAAPPPPPPPPTSSGVTKPTTLIKLKHHRTHLRPKGGPLLDLSYLFPSIKKLVPYVYLALV